MWLTFHPGADEAVILVAGVVIPLAGQQVVVTHGHAVFLPGQIETMRL